MDGGKADMAAAVQAYVQTLAAKKCIGLFYYAGHGIQLAWRNYMLPVDADLDTIADIQKQGVEVNSLLEGITKAANPMNVIILDACRDNPFGNLKGVDHKGLSQMDAPNNTIISYATAPGNVASDGEGANGLYTENLLRELKVPEAKVEDVFKRVRLNVRLKSKGAQVPWDSSSLEDDFYFLPPAQLQKLSQAEKDRLLNEELAAWDRAREAKDPKLIEAFCSAIREATSASSPSLRSTGRSRKTARRRLKQRAPLAIRIRRARQGRTSTTRWATATPIVS